MPNWSTVGVRVLRRPWVWVCGPLWLSMRVVSVRTFSRVDAQAFKNAGGNALSLSDEAKEKVLGANIVMIETPCLIHRQLNDFLGSGSQANITAAGAVATTNDKFDRGTYFV